MLCTEAKSVLSYKGRSADWGVTSNLVWLVLGDWRGVVGGPGEKEKLGQTMKTITENALAL